MDGRAKRIQLDAALNFAAQIDDENTDKLSSAPSKERFSSSISGVTALM
jgi:hypothetical protein